MNQIEVNENCVVCKKTISVKEVYEGTAIIFPVKGSTIDEFCETMHVSCHELLPQLSLAESLRIGLCHCTHCGKPFTLWAGNCWHMSEDNPLLHDPSVCEG